MLYYRVIIQPKDSELALGRKVYIDVKAGTGMNVLKLVVRGKFHHNHSELERLMPKCRLLAYNGRQSKCRKPDIHYVSLLPTFIISCNGIKESLL